MSSETIRPNGDAYKTGLTYSSGTTAHSLLSDNSDASYVQMSAGGYCAVDFAAPASFPAGGVVKSVTPRVRCAYSSGSTSTAKFRLVVGKNSSSPSSPLSNLASYETLYQTSSITTYTGSALPYAYATTSAWTSTDLGVIQLGVIGAGSATMRFHEMYLDILYADPPTVASVAVTGNTTSTPTVGWLYTEGGDGGPQARYEIKVFDSTTYGAGGFSPDTSTATYSVIGYGSASSAQIAAGHLVAATTYKAYVRVAQLINGEYQTSTGGTGDGWAVSSAFTYSPDPPGSPTLTVTPDSANFRAALVLQGHDNLLVEQDASFESTTGTAQAVLASCSLAQSTAQAEAPGTGSLRMTSLASGDMAAITATGVDGCPVVAGREYRFRAACRAAATTRTATLNANWYTAAGAFISNPSADTDSATSSGFVSLVGDLTAPPTAAFVALQIGITSMAGASEVFYWDHLAVQENAGNAPSSWTRGGFFASATADLYCKIEYQDAGSSEWVTVRGCSALEPGTNQVYATQYDTGLQPGVERTYRAIEYYVQSGSTTEGAAAAGSQTVDLDLTTWLLRCPADPTLDMVVHVVDEGSMVRRNPQGVFDILGAGNPVVVTDVRHEIEAALTIETTTANERAALLALLNSGETLLITGPSSDGAETRYIVPGDVVETRKSVPTSFWREWTIPYVQVAEPA